MGKIPKGNGTLQSDLVHFPSSAPTCSLPGLSPVQTSFSTGSLSGLTQPHLHPAKPVGVVGNVSLVASPNRAKCEAALSRPLAPQLSALLLQVTPSKDAFQENKTYPKGAVVVVLFFFFFNTEVQAFPRKTHPKGDTKFAEWPNGDPSKNLSPGKPRPLPTPSNPQRDSLLPSCKPQDCPFQNRFQSLYPLGLCFPAIPNSCPPLPLDSRHSIRTA